VPVKLCVPARIASSLEAFGSVKVRVVPALIPDKENSAFFVGSAPLTRLKIASDTSCGTPTGTQADPFHTKAAASAAIQERHPGRGMSRVQAPSTQ